MGGLFQVNYEVTDLKSLDELLIRCQLLVPQPSSSGKIIWVESFMIDAIDHYYSETEPTAYFILVT